MRVLVCGGRDYTNRVRVFSTLSEMHIKTKITHIIHGDARGVDRMARDWARIYLVSCTPYPADWDRYGKQAGYVRNNQMLLEGKPNMVVAFPGGRGTAMMVDIARKAGVPVVMVDG